MKVLIFSCLIAISLSFNLREAKQNYDSYVLAVQWSNGYCKANSCGGRADHVEKNTMTIHGLWPSLKSAKMLDTCTSGVKIIEEETPLFEKMRQYWPSFTGANTDFWEHEYNKHGFCMVEEYGWDGYEEYFDFVVDLVVDEYKYLIQKAFPDKSKTTFYVTYEEMIQKIRTIIPNATLKMNCKSKYIYEIYFYLEKDFTPSTDSRFSNTCTSAQLVFS